MATHRSSAPANHRRRMMDVRMGCEVEMLAQQERALGAAAALRRSLRSISVLAQQTLDNREKLVHMKNDFRESETELGRTLAVKTSKETKFTSFSEVLSSTVFRVQQAKKLLLMQRKKRDECAAVVSEQLASLDNSEEKSRCFLAETKKIEEAITWYKDVLGVQAEGGEGVKFIFQKLDTNNPDAGFTFTVRLENDVYKLLHSDPVLEAASGLIQDLNKTNDLFIFVRNMRQKFQDAALSGILPSTTSSYQDITSFMVSSPPPLSADSRTEVSGTSSSITIQPEGQQFVFPKMNDKSQISHLSPQCASSLRRSSRLMRQGGFGNNGLIPTSHDDLKC